MKKLFYLTTALLLLGAMAASGQTNSTTVANGTDTRNDVPIYGLHMSSWYCSQTIYPASMLADLVGSEIVEISLYNNTASSANYTWASDMRVKMGVTTVDAFPSQAYLTDTTVTVYVGTFTCTSGVLHIVFDSTFHYTGGNLLLEIATETKTGNYKDATFLGVNTDQYNIIRGYNAAGLGSIVNHIRRKFIPKTTFTFIGGSALPEEILYT